MPDSSSHRARKLCSSKSASTWREKVTSERSLRTQYTVSSMARARPSSARPGLGAERRGGGGAWLVLQADGTGCSLARPLAPSLPHTRSVTHSLPPSPASTAATTRLRLCLPPCRPASHHCRQARRPPGAPPRRNADAVNPAWPAPPSRRSEGAGLGRGGGKQERVGGGRGRRDGRRGRARKGMSRKEKLFIA